MVNEAEAPWPRLRHNLRPPLPPWKSGLWPLDLPPLLSACPPSLPPHWGSLSTSKPLQTKVLVGPGLLCKCTNFGQSEARISTQISRHESKVRVSSNHQRRSQKVDIRAVLRRRAAGPSI